MKLQGILIDTATPFDHSGELYKVKIEHNIGKWNRTSVAGYVAGGFTGEGAMLSAAEKTELWKLTAASAGPEKLLIAGVDCPGVREAAAQVNRAAELGFAAALAETPYYERSLRRTETQLLYFRSLADRTRIPILICHRPQETGVELSDETLLALAAHPNIGGMVDCSEDWARAGRVGPFPVLCGDERGVWKALQSGAAGAALALASAAPYAAIAVWEAFRAREEEAGLDWQGRIAKPTELLRRYGVGELKQAMDLNGYYGGPLRLPRTAPRPEEKIEIQRAFADLKS